MLTVTAGTDVYGAVRKVDGTPIVTKFAMLQFLPIFPIESYYLSRLGPQSHQGVPLVLAHSHQEVVGLRLAHVDRLSAFIAYLRGIGAALFLLGCMGLIFALVSSFSIPLNPRDPVQRYWKPVSGAILAIGVLVAGPTYYFTYVVTERDKLIRSYCGKVLGIAADPAQVDLGTGRELLDVVREALGQSGIDDPERAINNPSLADIDQKAALLVFVRARMAIDGLSDDLECLSDNLVLELKRASASYGLS